MLNKRYIYLILMGIVITVLTPSCKKFVDKDPFNQIDEDKAITTLLQAKYALTGIYDGLQGAAYYGRNYFVMGDAPTDNIIVPSNNSGRFLAEAQWTLTATSADLADLWNAVYDYINRTNKLLVALDGITGDETTKNQYKGEALALRAMMHFDLVRIFSQPYDFTPTASHFGVPYMDAPTVRDLPGRDSVSVVYSKVIRDLTTAIPLLQVTPAGRAIPYVFGKNAAKALLARVYLYKGDFPNAKLLSTDVIANGGYTLINNTSYIASWLLPKTTESILSVSNTGTDYQATNSLGYIYVQAGYGDLRVATPFRTLFAPTDVRRGIFTPGTGSNAAWTYVGKYPSRDNTNGLVNGPILRLSEMYLIAAEAAAKTSDEPNAIKYLDAIKQRAVPTAAATIAAGQPLIDSILLEKRRELCYEGHYYQDQKRLHLTITSALKDNGTPYTTITYPNNKLAYPIPQREIDANPTIASQQNPL